MFWIGSDGIWLLRVMFFELLITRLNLKARHKAEVLVSLNACSSLAQLLFMSSLLTAVGLCTFKTMILHHKPLAVLYNYMSQTVLPCWYSAVNKNAVPKSWHLFPVPYTSIIWFFSTTLVPDSCYIKLYFDHSVLKVFNESSFRYPWHLLCHVCCLYIGPYKEYG